MFLSKQGVTELYCTVNKNNMYFSLKVINSAFFHEKYSSFLVVLATKKDKIFQISLAQLNKRLSLI